MKYKNRNIEDLDERSKSILYKGERGAKIRFTKDDKNIIILADQGVFYLDSNMIKNITNLLKP